LSAKLEGAPLDETKLRLCGETLPENAGCALSMPVSMTATVTPLPVSPAAKALSAPTIGLTESRLGR
jgi:hypothetical protein